MAAPVLVAVTYNVLFAGGDPAATLAVIEASRADVVCLQEVTPRFERAFVRRLGRRYPHRRFASREGTWGVAVASTLPIASARTFAQEPHRMPAMEVVLQRDHDELVVACLHLFPPAARRGGGSILETLEENASLRLAQARALVARYAGERRPLLLLGDLNEGRSGDVAGVFLGAGLEDACSGRGRDCGGTYPGATSAWPAMFQVDHIFGRGVRFEGARVVRAGGSDHYPVIAELVVQTWQERYVAAARRLLGTPYRLGGRGDTIDCQGVLFLAAESVRACSWRSYSVFPTQSVAGNELGAPLPGHAPIASAELDLAQLEPADVLLLVGYAENPAEPAIGELAGRKVWVWHTGLYAGEGRWIAGDHFAGEAVEVDLTDYLRAHADTYAGVFVTRMTAGPSPRRCREERATARPGALPARPLPRRR